MISALQTIVLGVAAIALMAAVAPLERAGMGNIAVAGASAGLVLGYLASVWRIEQ